MKRLTELEFCREIARDAHAGQRDKQGRPYFEAHVEPIAGSLIGAGEHAVMAGYLHDVAEDCPDRYSIEHLREIGLPDDVIRAVDSVTRREGESYDDLITRSCADPLGIWVKLADNAHNILSAPGLAQGDPRRAESLLRRYLTARDRLIEARALLLSDIPHRPGICGSACPAMYDGATEICTLRAGHDGWHSNMRGTDWGRSDFGKSDA